VAQYTYRRCLKSSTIDHGDFGQTSCPLYPQEQTFADRAVMSALCQQRTHALRQKSFLFDHLVGQREQRGRHGEAERIRGLTINDEFELCRQLDG
jgi:hypothetical protein